MAPNFIPNFRKIVRAVFEICRYPRTDGRTHGGDIISPFGFQPGTNNDAISKVSIPYVKGTSERISKVFKKYKIGTTHKPSATIKSLLCNTLKDKVHHMDKSNTIYKFSCGKCEKVYIGETERSLRYRAHEHAVIPRRDSQKAHSLINEEERTETNPTNSDRPRRRGTTDISKHLAECPHRDEDYNFELIGTEPIWRRRVMKESLYLHRETKGTLLNQNMGKHRFGPIYNRLLGQPPTTQLQLLLSTQFTCGVNDSPVSTHLEIIGTNN